MAIKDYLKEVTPGIETFQVEDYSVDEFVDKDFLVKTVKGQSCNLCGFEFGFTFKMLEKDGVKIKVGNRYLLKASDFMRPVENKDGKPGKNKVSVLPEIMYKLTRPQNKVVELVMVYPAGESPSPKEAGKESPEKVETE